MTVSMEVIAMLASAATILVALVSGFGWMITRMDARFAQVDARFAQMDAKFAQMDAKFAQQDVKAESRFDRLEGRIDELTHEMGEVKIAIARLEGPTPRLITSR